MCKIQCHHGVVFSIHLPAPVAFAMLYLFLLCRVVACFLCLSGSVVTFDECLIFEFDFRIHYGCYSNMSTKGVAKDRWRPRAEKDETPYPCRDLYDEEDVGRWADEHIGLQPDAAEDNQKQMVFARR